MVRTNNQYNKDMHLTNYAIAERNKEGYVADEIFPYVAVEVSTGKVANNGRQGMALVNTNKADRGKYNKVTFEIGESKTYSIEKHGLIDDISNEEVDNRQIRGLRPLRELKTINLIGAIKNSYEKAVLTDIIANPAIMTNNEALTGTDQFQDPASEPLTIMRDKIEEIEKKTGQKVTKIMISKDVLVTLADNPQVVAKQGTTSGKFQVMNKKRVVQIIEDEFDVKVIVPSARIYDDSGVASYFIEKTVAMFAVSDAPSTDTVDFGKTFSLISTVNGAKGSNPMLGGGMGPTVHTMSLENTETGFDSEMSEKLKVRHNRAQFIQNIDCSYVLYNAIA